MDIEIDELMLKRWAKIYVDKILVEKVGPVIAKEWARRHLQTPGLVKQIAPYVEQEYKKRGIKR